MGGAKASRPYPVFIDYLHYSPHCSSTEKKICRQCSLHVKIKTHRTTKDLNIEILVEVGLLGFWVTVSNEYDLFLGIEEGTSNVASSLGIQQSSSLQYHNIRPRAKAALAPSKNRNRRNTSCRPLRMIFRLPTFHLFQSGFPQI